MTCTTCPKCGYDLEALHAFELGGLRVEYDGAIILWRGQRVALTQAERLIVLALGRAGGAIVKRHILAEASGYEGEDHALNVVSVYVCKIKNKFRDVDASFDRIETVWRDGVRWRVE